MPKNSHHRLPEILHWYACGADAGTGRSVYGHIIAKFSQRGSLPHFLTHGAPLHPLWVQEGRKKVMKFKLPAPYDAKTTQKAHILAYYSVFLGSTVHVHL